MKEDLISVSDLIIHILKVTDNQVYVTSMICTVKKAVNDKTRITPDHVKYCRVSVQCWNAIFFLFLDLEPVKRPLDTPFPFQSFHSSFSMSFRTYRAGIWPLN